MMMQKDSLPTPKLVALCLLALAILAACVPAREVDTITFACYDYEHSIYEPLVSAFQAQNPDVNVQLLSVGDPSSTTSADLFRSLAETADTFVGSSLMLGGATPQDVVLDLTSLAEGDPTFAPDDFEPGALGVLRSDGKLWGLPLTLNLRLVFYNRELFRRARAAGLSVREPQIGWSWSEFVDDAVALAGRDPASDAIMRYGYVDPMPFYTLPALASQRVGALVDADAPGETDLTQPGVATALQWYRDLVTVYGVMLDPRSDPDTIQETRYEFAPAMWAGATFERDSFAAKYGDVGVVPFPEAGAPATDLVARAAFVSAGTPHPEAAWRWIAFLTRQAPGPLNDSIPARRSVGEATGFWRSLDAETATTYRYALDHAVAFPQPVYDALDQAYTEMLEGTPAAEALFAAQVQLLQAFHVAAAESARPPTAETPVATAVPGETTVRFALPYDADREAYQHIIERFGRRYPGISVSLLSPPAAQADVLVTPAPTVGEDGELLQRDTLPLTAFATTDGLDLSVYPAAVLARTMPTGDLLALPLQVDATLLYYNRTLFDALGAPYPDGSWTPETFVEAAVALTDPAVLEPRYGFYPYDGAYGSAPGMIAWLGGQLFDAADMPTFDDASVVEAVRDYVRLITEATPPTTWLDPPPSRFARTAATATEAGRHPGPVSRGSIALWTAPYRQAAHAVSPGFEIGVAPFLPGMGTGRPIETLAISAQTPDPEAAWAWLRFSSGEPDVVTALPLSRAIAANPRWQQRAGAGTATAWVAILDSQTLVEPAWERSVAAQLSLTWLDQALAESFAGADAEVALQRAELSAAAFAQCANKQQPATVEAWRACARQADPTITLPEE